MSPASWGSAFEGRRVLLTGHTGFKGGWLALWLKRLGARVTGYALPPRTGDTFFRDARVAEGMTSIMGDIRDLPALIAAFRKHRPELVFHLAAQPLVRLSYEEPVETFAVNVLGTVHVLEAVRKTPSVAAAVVVTSDKCYENRGTGPAYVEGDAMGGHDPYSASKGAAELVTASYRRSFFADRIGLASARAGNVVGGGDWAKDRILPDCARALRAGKPIVVRNPASVRPWQHVLEPLSGYLQLAARLLDDPGRFSGPWNFGPADSERITVLELTRLFVKAWGSGKFVIRKDIGAVHEARTLALDPAKAAKLLGWRSALSAEETIAETVAWYKASGTRGFDAAAFTLGQIDAYGRRAAEAAREYSRGTAARRTAVGQAARA
ncbi:MAG: CDP-glucose 4,6-dehydratase [Elusimicrobia bacterium]|nr:CDP-glucose 4,6-dehydratase [Elusimicrobiota bacterium]